MQDFGTKADNSAPPGGQLSAAEFNNLATENENAVSRSGQTLSGASSTQLATSLFLHGVKSETFQDSGAANAYVATPVSGASGTLLPADYSAMNGAVILFKASNASTGASTLNIGQTTGTLLGAKAIVDQAGVALTSGAITGLSYIQLRYDSSIGAGSWVLMQWAASRPTGATKVAMVITAAGASATLTADSITLNSSIGGQVYQLVSFSKTINLATTGAGGMDTGAAPVSGYVGIYAIYNPTTGVSALLATNATSSAVSEVYGGANMPAGFSASALVSVWTTTAAQLLSIGFQRDRTIAIPAVLVLNSASVVGLTSLSITGAVPRNAGFVNGYVQVSSTSISNISVTVYPSTTQTGGGQPFIFGGAPASALQSTGFSTIQVVTPGAIGYSTTNGAGTPSFQIFINSYVI